MKSVTFTVVKLNEFDASRQTIDPDCARSQVRFLRAVVGYIDVVSACFCAVMFAGKVNCFLAVIVCRHVKLYFKGSPQGSM